MTGEVTEVRRIVRRVVRHGVAGLAGAGMGAAAQFLLVLAVTRAFDAATAGRFFALTTGCLMIAGIVRLDAGNGLLYFVARATADRKGGIWSYLMAAVPPVALISITVSLIVFFEADIFGGIAPDSANQAANGIIYHDNNAASPSPPGGPGDGVGAALRVLAAAFPVIVLAEVFVAATRGFGAMRPTVLLGGVVQPVAQLALVAAVAAWWHGGGAPGGPVLPWLAAAWALPYLPVLAVAAAWLGRRVRREPYLPGTAREFWRHTAPRSAGSAVQHVFQRLDVVVVAALAGPVEAAVYTAATRFKVLGQLAGQGLAQAAQPTLVRALATGDLAVARAVYRRTTNLLVALTWPVWLGYAALAPALLGVFGDRYAAGADVAVVLAATMMVAAACGMADVALVAAGRTAASLAGILAATAVTVAVDLALVPSLGAFGAALGWSAGVVVKNALPLAQIWRSYGLRPFGANLAGGQSRSMPQLWSRWARIARRAASAGPRAIASRRSRCSATSTSRSSYTRRSRTSPSRVSAASEE
ncbi:hypothetical protein GCM10010106_20920 [Thermopolyspora flexuosa]|uniref:O-antigen/teichoic acid export membrane protein n=1 Tax=Thermopolyspora flexuosa TaxID=103836 RepID=A0A543J3B8_9ACTN|nr:O-antigen/teichoic acid export membrane protein [Thermopolyspora flexuosa]GGM74177.1 hypothetical protein GCM10010106_20920 [Thermopolyspora flexuosa]